MLFVFEYIPFIFFLDFRFIFYFFSSMPLFSAERCWEDFHMFCINGDNNNSDKNENIV